MVMTINKQKQVAKTLAPLFKRYHEIDTELEDDVPVQKVKKLSIELADNFIKVVNLCSQHGFPERRTKVYVKTCTNLKQSIAGTNDENAVGIYTTYLLAQYQALEQIIGVA